ncbi:MAG: SPFH domain-containing protein [Candidatus Kapaibacterium sp.]
MDFLELLIPLAGIGALALVIILITISRLLLIAHPNEVIILSGRKRKLENGETVGYRTIRGGRTIKVPLLEKATRMSLETIPIELMVSNAYSKGGIPLRVEAIANIKIASQDPFFGNAVERFLNRKEGEIHSIAKDTLEGNLRGVLASLTPEEVNEDRLKFAETLMDEADIDLQKLGLQLDTLKITNISDDNDYLNSIGRGKTAEVIANAKKIEAAKKAESEQAEAEAQERAERAKAISKQNIEQAQIESEQNVLVSKAMKNAETREAEALSEQRAAKAQAAAKQEIELAQIIAEQNIFIANTNKKAATEEADSLSRERAEKAKAIAKQAIEQAQIDSERAVLISKALADQQIEIEKNNYRIKKAELEKVAVVKEKEAEVAGTKAKVKFEQELEEERIVLQKKRLMADVIEPAKARKEALELEAKGQAASILADGEAQIEILRRKIEAYISAQGSGDKVFMLNMLPQIIEQLVATVKDVKIDKISIIDSGSNNGSQFAKVVNQVPGAVVNLAEMLENATGIDILSTFRNNMKDEADIHTVEAETDYGFDGSNYEDISDSIIDDEELK